MVSLALLLLLSLTLVAGAKAEEVRHRKLQASGDGVIPGEYIVELYPEYKPRDNAPALIRAFASSSGGGGSAALTKVTNYYDEALNGFAVKNLASSDLKDFLDSPEVKKVWHVSDERYYQDCLHSIIRRLC
jgi:hypothetical protein